MGNPKSACRALAGLLPVAAATWAEAQDPQPRYQVTVISAPACATTPAAVAYGLNDQDAVVGMHTQCGFEDGIFDAFIWRPQSGLVTLPRLVGYTDARVVDVNDAGDAVGRVENSEALRAVLWNDGEAIDLGVPPGGTWSQAVAINSAGLVVGEWLNVETGVQHGFVWQGGVMADLGAVLATPASSGLGVSDQGHVTGWMGSSLFADARAYVLLDGQVTELPPVPGGFTSQGRAVNNLGQVAVQGLREADDEPFPVLRSCLWDGQAMIDLGALPGTIFVSALDLNDGRQIVGTCDNLGPPLPFLWQDGVMTNLRDHIDDPDGLVQFNVPYAIDDAGRIAGSAVVDGQPVGVLLTPVDGPPGDVNGDGDVGIDDFLALLAAWGACPQPPDACPSDFDGDGVVGVVDFLILLANWV
ncbi:MAG: hypothetical protein ACYSWT_16765 [Planctomycetota bacterium]|jgi:probable HAF family extracellular repeat protein